MKNFFVSGMRVIVLSILCLSWHSDLFAQDFHFSQFESNPVSLNPAHAGVFLGDFRGAMNYRKQWSTVSGFGSDYRTADIALDANLFKRKNRKGNFAGIGGEFYTDKIGDSHLMIKSYNLDASFVKSLSPDRQRYFLSLGARVGYNQRSVSSAGLKWDSQWNVDHYDPSLPGEDGIRAASNYIDVTVGGLWFDTGTKFKKYHLGFVASHLTAPNVSFYGMERLKQKFTFHGGATFSTDASNKVLQPGFLVTKQGRALEITGGTWFRYVTKEGSMRSVYSDEKAISFGVWYRVSDAIIAAMKYDYKNIAVGISYDITLSGFSPASSFSGGPEISIVYSSTPRRVGMPGQYKNVRYL